MPTTPSTTRRTETQGRATAARQRTGCGGTNAGGGCDPPLFFLPIARHAFFLFPCRCCRPLSLTIAGPAAPRAGHDRAAPEPWRLGACAAGHPDLGHQLRGHEVRPADSVAHAAERAALRGGVAALFAVRAPAQVGGLALSGRLWSGAGRGPVRHAVPGPEAGHAGRHGLGGAADAGLRHAAAGRLPAGRARAPVALAGPGGVAGRAGCHWQRPWRGRQRHDAGRLFADRGRSLHVGRVQHDHALCGAQRPLRALPLSSSGAASFPSRR